MRQGFFITGTDTGVGKTWSTVSLMRYFAKQGNTVLAMKPIASGCVELDGCLRSEDALLLQQNASFATAYADVNPYALQQPISPHIAAAMAKTVIRFETILSAFERIKRGAEIVLVEGVGGWRVPLTDRQDVADLAIELNLPVIVVVAIRLGCINHARLTYDAILASGVPCAGWIATCIDPGMLHRRETINTLRKALRIPLLGVLPYSEVADFDFFANKINLSKCR